MLDQHGSLALELLYPAATNLSATDTVSRPAHQLRTEPQQDRALPSPAGRSTACNPAFPFPACGVRAQAFRKRYGLPHELQPALDRKSRLAENLSSASLRWRRSAKYHHRLLREARAQVGGRG